MAREQLIAHARASIMRGSRSFAIASRLFDRRTREKVWLLYAWCRACDDLADAQDHGGALGEQSGAADRLATIRELTARALTAGETGNPAFDALGLLSRETGITAPMIEDVIAGFALDAADWRPRSEIDMLRYCFHVAGAVGVMTAVIMGVSPDDDEMLDRACDLGLAFQLANIARDLSEDKLAGRCYLPLEWLAQADIPPGELMKPHYRGALVPLVRRLCAMERDYEASARIGAARLPFRCRWAVLSAAGIYGAIAREVDLRGAHAWDRRVTIPAITKLGLVLRGLWQALTPSSPSSRPEFSRRELAIIVAQDAALHAAR